MVKISFILVMFLSSLSFAETYSFAIGDSSIYMTNDGREFKYFIDTYQGQILFRCYLPGDNMSKKKISTSCECGEELLKIEACAILQRRDAPERNMIFFSPERLLQQYMEYTYAYAGLKFNGSRKYSVEEIRNFLKAAKNWEITIL
jgi:hypothetical protein